MKTDLAIIGHKDQGKEVIRILEMLGGRNVNGYTGSDIDERYTIDEDGDITQAYVWDNCVTFTLEEFLEKFPYKIGDRVKVNGNEETVNRMCWDEEEKEVRYGFFTFRNIGEITASNINPVIKEEVPVKEINVAELLRNCPKGTELYSPIYGNGILIKVTNRIHVKFPKEHNVKCFRADGRVSEDGEIMIFPKGKTTWEGFQKPFEDGDILAYTSIYTTVFIYRNRDNEPKHTTSFYVGYTIGGSYHNFHIYNKSLLIALNGDCETRLATEEEKEKLFQAIKDNGYEWNSETKTLKKLIDPIFKVGDKVRVKGGVSEPRIIDEVCDTFYALVPIGKIDFTDQDRWELAPDKFNITTLVPFESRVLIRDDKLQKWSPAIWGFYDPDARDYQYKLVGVCARYCIPYEGNEHLLGKTSDCDEYFKTWK